MFVVVPVVVGSWPLISAAIVAAGAAMGYQATKSLEERIVNAGVAGSEPLHRSVRLRMENSQVVSDTLMRGEEFTMEKNGMRATFRVDGRGACVVHMDGDGKTEAELEAAGRELMDKVRQQFAYSKVMAELEERGFQVVQQEVQENQSIRISVRRM
jgi:hypothetical protein